MGKGIKRVLTFYCIGFILALISYITIGPLGAHSPSLHHFIFFLIFIIGCLGSVLSLFQYLHKKTKEKQLILIVNVIIVLSILLVFKLI